MTAALMVLTLLLSVAAFFGCRALAKWLIERSRWYARYCDWVRRRDER